MVIKMYKKIKNDEFIICFSNSNYRICTGGTENFIRSLENIYLEKNISFINFFAISYSNKICGLNIDGKFIGLYDLLDVYDIVSLFASKKKCKGILLQHIKGFDLRILTKVLKKIDIDIIIQIHDYYYLCNTFNFMKNKKEFCGLSSPSKSKCRDCYNYKSLIEFQKNRDNFFKELNGNIKRIIFPSEFCKNSWLNFFPQFKSISCVREHLLISGYYKKNISNNKKRLAYIGRKNYYKGIETWNTIIKNKKVNKKYELYYFGIDIDNTQNIKEIYTKSNMLGELRKNNIDYVILWSMLPETYSYTYYEASASGAFIITNEISGNINYNVNKNKNGVICKNVDELLLFLLNDNYKNEYNSFAPDLICDNKSISDYLFPNTYYSLTYSGKKIKNKKALSIIYKFRKKV